LFRTGRWGNFAGQPAFRPRRNNWRRATLQLWTEPRFEEMELDRMRASNARVGLHGQDLSGVVIWPEMGLRNPAAKQDYLKVMTRIIGETMRLEQERGMVVSF